LRVQCVCVDTTDPDRIARFWAAALGWRRVPEGKTAKNRLHLDLRPDDQQAEVERLQALGASPVCVGQDSEVTWVVLADPIVAAPHLRT